jgi:hypothetical protein
MTHSLLTLIILLLFTAYCTSIYLLVQHFMSGEDIEIENEHIDNLSHYQ